MGTESKYTEELRKIRSLLIVTSLQKKQDIEAIRLIKVFSGDLNWVDGDDLMINEDVWKYAVESRGYDPKLVFCHPAVLLDRPETSLYYRGLCGLSLKAVKDYVGTVERLEQGSKNVRFSSDKALKMARTYNTFICSIIENSSDWTLENGRRTIVATLGITLDGKMRNNIGDIAEERMRTLILEWLLTQNLIIRPRKAAGQMLQDLPDEFTLRGGIVMRFGSEPDIAFLREGEFIAIVEIKGGIDPAGALERYGAATKSFQNAVGKSPMCQNFFVSAVFTEELTQRIERDRLVNKSFDLVNILYNPGVKEEFLNELFHHTLRMI